MSRSCSRFAAMLLAASVLSCGDEPLTQLVVVVDSDLPTRAMDSIAIDVRSATGAHQVATLPVTASRPLPASVSLVHRAGPLGLVDITVVARLGGEVVGSRLARTSFVRGQTRALRVHLLGACVGISCADARWTCGERGCAPPEIPPESLDRWSGALPPPLVPELPAMDAGERDGGLMDATANDARDVAELADAGDGGTDDASTIDMGDGGPACVPRHPAPRPAATDPSESQRFFAIERFDIGMGAPAAWRELGLDLDDRCTSSESRPDELECATLTTSSQPDGEDGIDNQFGAAILPALTSIDPDLFDDFNTSFLRGTYGLVLSVSGWNLTGTDDTVSVALLEATRGRGPFGPPEHLGGDTWTISSESVIDDDLAQPVCAGMGWVVEGVVVAELPSRCGFRMTSADGNVVIVRLSRPTLVATIEGRAPGFGNGLLVGRWRVTDFVEVLRHMGDPFCPDASGPTIEMALHTGADVRAEGSADPGVGCDAVSFGARFRGGPAEVDPTVGEPFTPTDYCL